MSERLLYSLKLKSVRTAPPGYDIPTCQGTVCQVTTENLIIPGAAYGSKTPLRLIGECEEIRREGALENFVRIDTMHYHMTLCCNTYADCEQLAHAIRTSPGYVNP